jgi:hypothetical protein
MTLNIHPFDGIADAASFDITSAPYPDQEPLIRDQLHAIRARVRAATVHLETPTQDEPAAPSWPHELLAAEARIEARVLASTALPITAIRDRFGLSASEDRVLWTLIAHELCPIARGLIRGLATEQTLDPSTDTIRRLVYGASRSPRVWSELGEDGTLRRYAFIERTDSDPEAPEHRQTWKVGRRVLSLVYGVLGTDPALADVATVDAGPPPVLDRLELAGDAAILIDRAFDRVGVILVHGRVGHGRRSVLTAIATQRGLSVLHVQGRAIAKERDAAQRELRAIARECRLLDLTPLVRDLDALAGNHEVPDRLDLVEAELPGLVLATASHPIARRWRRAPMAIELAAIGGSQRKKLWSRALPMAGSGDCELLATMYPLAPGLIESAGEMAVEQSMGGEMRTEHIEAGLRAVLDDRLAGLATRVTVTQSWDDLVLPDDQTMAILDLLARVRERRRVYEDWGFGAKVGKGLGVTALFSGPPGTGKSMVAGLVARSLRTELYQVDLSKVVSKWIGETEKNLAALFDSAEAGHAILLFDEADALFGKRTDVKSSNDRHANQETNYLLQRLESYAGICLLTSNHETAIDAAFQRRLAVHVQFPLPEAEDRKRLWRAMIPTRAPTEGDLGIDALATTYAMAGGHIRNAVLRAAFLAADEQGAINATRLTRAAQLEYEGLGKVVSSRG